jgi:hypothetical protein
MSSIERVVLRILACVAIVLALAVQNGWSVPPPNDNFANATEIIASGSGGLTNSFSGTCVAATVEPGENLNPDLAAYNQLGTVWWKWSCTTDGSVEFLVCSSSASLMAGAFAIEPD